MPRYSIKLGEVHLVADEPIGPEQKIWYENELKKDGLVILIDGNTEVILRLDSHGNGASVKPVR